MYYLLSELSEAEKIILSEIAVNGSLKKILDLELRGVKEQLCGLTIGDDALKFACTYFALQEKIVYIEGFILMIDDLFNTFYKHQVAEEDS